MTEQGGRTQQVVSDAGWQVHLARSWKPGQYKRWFLRALQEEFDARLYPYGWTEPTFTPDHDWLPAMEVDGKPDKPAVCNGYDEYQFEIFGNPAQCEIRRRSVPLLRKQGHAAAKLTETLWLTWHRPPVEYFECLPPDSFTAERPAAVREVSKGVWQVPENGAKGAVLTFEMAEQVVGWPLFTIEAPAGTTVELLVHEAHQPGGPPLLNTHFHAWTRFTCREGVNHFETFDFESLRWLHLHIHNYKGPVTIRNVGTRRRQFPWPQKPLIACNDARIQKVLAASVNTLHNCAQETIVDGMGRERQQYSGDGGHQIHAVYATFGETRLPARYISTFSQGMTPGGYFMDSWPAYDRLARVMERQLQLTGWGPILDHSVGFVFDCYHHYMQMGNLDEVREAFPRLLRFLDYLRSIQGKDGLLPVEHLGIPSVWIDHEAYQQQRHKQCAFNLYTAAMAGTALTTLCKAFSESQWEQVSREFSQSVHRACVNQFWSKRHEVFVNNLPWLDRESQMRTCDRSLATSVLYDFCPDGLIEPAIAMLADPPPHLGLSYPANAIWRMWALAKGRRMDVILKDLRERWYAMDSVQENNTLQENWKARRDTYELWSHCPLGPLIIFHQGIVGVQPLEAGFVRCRLTPQPADLTSASITTHTVKGPIFFALKGAKGDRQITLRLPSGCLGELVLDERERVRLPALQSAAAKGMRTFLLEGGREKQLHLKYT